MSDFHNKMDNNITSSRSSSESSDVDSEDQMSFEEEYSTQVQQIMGAIQYPEDADLPITNFIINRGIENNDVKTAVQLLNADLGHKRVSELFKTLQNYDQIRSAFIHPTGSNILVLNEIVRLGLESDLIQNAVLILSEEFDISDRFEMIAKLVNGEDVVIEEDAKSDVDMQGGDGDESESEKSEEEVEKVRTQFSSLDDVPLSVLKSINKEPEGPKKIFQLQKALEKNFQNIKSVDEAKKVIEKYEKESKNKEKKDADPEHLGVMAFNVNHMSNNSLKNLNLKTTAEIDEKLMELPQLIENALRDINKWDNFVEVADKVDSKKMQESLLYSEKTKNKGEENETTVQEFKSTDNVLTQLKYVIGKRASKLDAFKGVRWEEFNEEAKKDANTRKDFLITLNNLASLITQTQIKSLNHDTKSLNKNIRSALPADSTFEPFGSDNIVKLFNTARNIYTAYNGIYTTQTIDEMFSDDNPWLDVAILNEVNNPMPLTSGKNFYVAEGPHLKSTGKNKNDQKRGQNEYFPLLIRANTDITYKGFFVVDTKGKIHSDLEPGQEFRWDKNERDENDRPVKKQKGRPRKGQEKKTKANTNQTYRPIVVHQIKKGDDDSGQEMWVAGVHTTPLGDTGITEFVRASIFNEIEKALDALKVKAAEDGIPLFIGGDFYLTKESAVKTVKEQDAKKDPEIKSIQKKIEKEKDALQEELDTIYRHFADTYIEDIFKDSNFNLNNTSRKAIREAAKKDPTHKKTLKQIEDLQSDLKKIRRPKKKKEKSSKKRKRDQVATDTSIESKNLEDPEDNINLKKQEIQGQIDELYKKIALGGVKPFKEISRLNKDTRKIIKDKITDKAEYAELLNIIKTYEDKIDWFNKISTLDQTGKNVVGETADDDIIGSTAGKQLKGMGYKHAIAKAGTNEKKKDHSKVQIADYGIYNKQWKKGKGGIMTPEGTMVVTDTLMDPKTGKGGFDYLKFWRAFSDHLPVGAILSLDENEDIIDHEAFGELSEETKELVRQQNIEKFATMYAQKQAIENPDKPPVNITDYKEDEIFEFARQYLSRALISSIDINTLIDDAKKDKNGNGMEQIKSYASTYLQVRSSANGIKDISLDEKTKMARIFLLGYLGQLDKPEVVPTEVDNSFDESTASVEDLINQIQFYELLNKTPKSQRLVSFVGRDVESDSKKAPKPFAGKKFGAPNPDDFVKDKKENDQGNKDDPSSMDGDKPDTDFNDPIFKKEKKEQTGWSCGDLAIELDRNAFLEFLQKHSDDREFRKLLAPEIIEAAKLSHANEKEKEDLLRIIDSSISFKSELQKETNPSPELITTIQTLIDRVNQKIANLEAEDTFHLPKEMLKGAENMKSISNVLDNYYSNQNTLDLITRELNAAIKTKIDDYDSLSPQELFNALDENQFNIEVIGSKNLFNKFRNQYETVNNIEKEINTFAEDKNTFTEYIEKYYNKKGWMVAGLDESFGDEDKRTSIIDLAARYKEAQIFIYVKDKKNNFKLFRKTSYTGSKDPIYIYFNGVNHFVGMNSAPPIEQ